jgi:hypothetical protein
MMKKLVILPLVIALFILVVSLTGLSPAQEKENNFAYSWGTVKSVSGSEIVLTEEGEETGEEVDVSYNISPEVELNNIAKIEDIAVGNSIGIEYEVIDGSKVAKVIDTEESFPQEAENNNLEE